MKHLTEALLMSTHNMFLWRNKKILHRYASYLATRHSTSYATIIIITHSKM